MYYDNAFDPEFNTVVEDKQHCMAILSEYMAPGSNEINKFAQTGELWKGSPIHNQHLDYDNPRANLIDAIKREISEQTAQMNFHYSLVNDFSHGYAKEHAYNISKLEECIMWIMENM